MKRNIKYVAFGVVLSITTVLLCELVLRIAVLLLAERSITFSQAVPLQVQDPILGVRGNPLYPGHDRRGFRNLSVPDQTSIVTLGDSQTYGVGVFPEQAWPMQLARVTNTTTYSMAFGSYGPTHSLIMIEEALALEPELVIEAFYSGNDLYDSYMHVHKMGQLPELRTTRSDTLRRIAEAEKDGSIKEKAGSLFQSALLWKQRPPPLRKTAAEELASRYELIRLGRKILRRINRAEDRARYDPRQFDEEYWQVVRRESSKKAGHRMILQYQLIRTVFTPRYRLLGLDLRDPRIEEGLQIALGAIERMDTRLKPAGLLLMVLLIPTKELVFKPVVQVDGSPAAEAYLALIENEEEMWRRTKVALNDLRIPYLDTLPALRALVESGTQPYPVSWDGHMNAIGHRAVANLVRSSIPKLVASSAKGQ